MSCLTGVSQHVTHDSNQDGLTLPPLPADSGEGGVVKYPEDAGAETVPVSVNVKQDLGGSDTEENEATNLREHIVNVARFPLVSETATLTLCGEETRPRRKSYVFRR